MKNQRLWISTISALLLCSVAYTTAKTLSARSFLRLAVHTPERTAVQWIFHPEQLQLRNAGDTITVLDFPSPSGSDLILQLYPHRSIFAPNLQIQIVGRDGKTRLMAPPRMEVFSGHIVGDPSSDVLLCRTGNWLFLLLSSEQLGTWLLAPAEPNALIHQYTPFAIPAEAPFTFTCYEPPEKSDPTQLLDPTTLVTVDFSDLFIAPIAIECDSDLYRRMGKDTVRIARYVGALLQAVSRLYEKEVNVALELTWLRIWTEGNGEDPYTADGNIPGLLQQLTQYWRANHLDVDRAITHLLTARSGQGGVGGIAWRDHLCDPMWNFSVSAIDGGARFPVTRYVWDVMVVAHEMGHNFRARHTHDCWWNPPLDTCVTKDGNPPVADACYRSPIKPRQSPGSIMSYCHLINSQGVRLWFSPRVATVLRQAVEENAYTCLRQPTTPVVYLIDPIGNQTFSSLEPLTIHWTAAKTAKVDLEYADASMQQWHRIATVNADQQLYTWHIPENLTDTAIYIRVVANIMRQVADTSGILYLRRPTLQWTSKLDRAEFAVGKLQSLLWTGTLVDTVSIEFSADSMQSWTPVAENIPNSGYFQWQIPDHPTNNGFLRIYDVHHPAVADTNPLPFRIGVPHLAIVKPDAQTIWIAGTQDTILWDAAFLPSVRIELSTDDGTSWQRLKLSVPARQKQLVITVPHLPTTAARIRLRNSDLSVVSDRFTIQAAPTSVSQLGSSAIFITPNPAHRQLFLRIDRAGTYALTIFSVTGIRMLRQNIATASAAVIPIEIWELPPGLYTVQLRTPTGVLHQQLLIVQP